MALSIDNICLHIFSSLLINISILIQIFIASLLVLSIWRGVRNESLCCNLFILTFFDLTGKETQFLTFFVDKCEKN